MAIAGRYAEAEPLLQRASAISEKALGPEHPDLAIPLNNLAALYRDTAATGRPSHSSSGSSRILDKGLPSDHPNLAMGRENYAILLDALGRSDEAAVLRAEAAAIHQRGEQAQASPR